MTSSATAWLERVLRPVGSIDEGWLRQVLPADALDAFLRRAAGQRRHATRALARQLQSLGTQPPWGEHVDAPVWLAALPDVPQAMALRLGGRARQDWLRTQVVPQVVGTLIGALGVEGYRRLLTDAPLNVQTPSPMSTPVSVDAVPHLMSWGAALLELHLGAQSPATRFRLRLVLPPAVWRDRPRDLVIDPAELAAAVEDAAALASPP
jgi:hypothetical protein